MIAARKKNRLKMKYPMKLWPFRPATRAGQNVIAIQMTATTIHPRTDIAVSSPRSPGMLMPAVRRQRWHGNDIAAPGRFAHHPGITPGGVICGDRDRWPGALRRPGGLHVPASTLILHRRGGARGSSCPDPSSARSSRRTSMPVGSRERGGMVVAGADQSPRQRARPQAAVASSGVLCFKGLCRHFTKRVIRSTDRSTYIGGPCCSRPRQWKLAWGAE